jgi:hypothetical protein
MTCSRRSSEDARTPVRGDCVTLFDAMDAQFID